ncbi:hypothetical protein WR25_25377 [Diploscapter pachys]|uniref:GTP-binding protein n=1 Tax=Diploscapter pachys TaxID=2018661 RepID=A0A2A2JR93_9BILA|nr:hypothetical protein WR25_25377 [Diploscapter pachys]
MMSAKRKVLLMGKSGSGKTSMRSIIFANYVARDTNRIGPTIDVEHAHVRFLGNLVLHLWDCGGQETFMDNYLISQKEQVFRNVQVLIYVFDVDSREFERDLRYYQSCLEALLHNSPKAKVFCLVHKMDLISEDQREATFNARVADIVRYSNAAAGAPTDRTEPIAQCFKSSIWDETLYKAWSAIVYQLIPNVEVMSEKLQKFAKLVEADEVLLFERATFLVVAHAEIVEHRDAHRFEKVSNIIKQFKLSCSKTASQFDYMHINNSRFSAFIDVFTQNTVIMVILSDTTVTPATMGINIKRARQTFEKIEALGR